MKKMTDTFKLNNGYEIPCVGFGTWQTPDGDTAIKAVSEAIRAGYCHIDTAACYGNETSVGKGLKFPVWNEAVFLLQARFGIPTEVTGKRWLLLKKRWLTLNWIIWICI